MLLGRMQVECVLDLVPETGLAVALEEPEVVALFGDCVDEGLSVGGEAEADAGLEV